MPQIHIKADTNDADYITEVSDISEEDLEIIKPLIMAIKNFQPYKGKSKSGNERTHSHNYPRSEYSPRKDLGEKVPQEIYSDFDEEIFEIFEYYCPFGIHSIISIIVYPDQVGEKLL